jgi:hypothetical protein
VGGGPEDGADLIRPPEEHIMQAASREALTARHAQVQAQLRQQRQLAVERADQVRTRIQQLVDRSANPVGTCDDRVIAAEASLTLARERQALAQERAEMAQQRATRAEADRQL